MTAASAKRTIKWLLLIFVSVFAVVNYFAFVESLMGLVSVLGEVLQTYGYNFSIEEPISFFAKILPGMGLITVYLSLDNKGFVSSLKEFYKVITITQLLILAAILPFFLYLQNSIFGKVIKPMYGAK